MNKNKFLKELSNKTDYDKDKCVLINSIIEDTFIIGRKSKEELIGKFKDILNINDEEANKLYEDIMTIIRSEVKEKLKHPFKRQD